MSAYDQISRGSLKFKGDSSSTKKKKKKSKSDKQKLSKVLKDGQDNNTADDDKKLLQVVGKTDAELKFEKKRREREMARVTKAAAKSHKERVAEFNSKLEKLSEHYDIPKVGPG